MGNCPQFAALRDSRFPVHKIADDLEPYLRVIVDHIHPQKIILFGSQAYGQPGNDSDVDLLIIRSDLHSSKESNIEIRNLFWDVQAPPISFSIISKTPEQVEEKIESGSSVFQEIVGKGVTLYAA